MKKLSEKLHSQSGASILLALLFLLVCMMAAASILTAAVSNAGKIRSNYEEQQRYLALSSALRLVAGELEQAEYRGRYAVSQWTEREIILDEDGNPILDEDGNPVAIERNYYKIDQKAGAFSCGELAELETTAEGTDGKTKDGALLSFQKELDGLFAKEFTDEGYQALEGADIAPLPTTAPQRVLTVTVQDGGVTEKDLGPVKVEIRMDRNRRVHLKAVLNAGTDAEPINYVMEAELSPNADMPTVQYPLDRIPKSEKDLTLVIINETTETKITDGETAVKWELDWITGEVKEAGG